MYADVLQRSFCLLTLLEALQLDNECTLVRALTGDEVVARDTHTAGDSRVGSEHTVYLVHHLVGLLHRGARRC